MRISDWSSDVCSSDLQLALIGGQAWQAFRQIDGKMELGAPGALGDQPLDGADHVVGIDLLVTQCVGAGLDLGDVEDVVDQRDRESVVSGKSVPVRVDLGGRRIITKKTTRDIQY